MGLADLHNNIKCSRGLSPVAAVTDNTAFVSEIVDTSGFESTEFVILTGSLADADATFTTLFEDGAESDLSDNAAVVDGYLLGDEVAGNGSFTFAEDNTAIKIGYIGPKRYCRVTVTPASNSGNVFVAGCWVQGNPKKAPQSTQQV